MKEIIELQTQSLHDSCTSTSIAMILGVDQQLIIDEYHERHLASEIMPDEYFRSKGLDCKLHYTRDNVRQLEPDRVYLMCVPSLNILGGLHSMVSHTFLNEEGNLMWWTYDPNNGYEGRKFYPDDHANIQWMLDISVSVADLLKWREDNHVS
jgi:hypothetical protein